MVANIPKEEEAASARQEITLLSNEFREALQPIVAKAITAYQGTNYKMLYTAMLDALLAQSAAIIVDIRVPPELAAKALVEACEAALKGAPRFS